MGITIEFKDFAEVKAFARELLGAGTAEVENLQPAPVAEPTPETLPAPEEPIPTFTAPVEEKPPTDGMEKKYSIEEVRAFLASKTKAGKRAEVQAILKEMGGGKLSSVDPARYGELMGKAEAL